MKHEFGDVPQTLSFIVLMHWLSFEFMPSYINVIFVQGKVYNNLADHIAEYMATTLFNTSTFKLDADTYR
jgi:5-methylthioribose kinase